MLSRIKHWQAALLGVFTAVAITLTNCTPSQPTDTASPGASPTATTGAATLVFGSGGDPANLESGNITDGNSIYVQQQIYDRLIDFEPGTTNLAPGLATEWENSDDGLTWTFTLRNDVTFHDGTPFNAEAVRANINRWWDPADPLGFRDAGKTFEIWSDLFGGYKGDENSLLSAINVVNDTTIEFVLSQPFAAFPAAIASGYFGIASPTAIEQAGADYGIAGSTAVGTGPFKFVEWRTGDRIVLERNPDYWRDGLPKVDQVVFRFIREPASRLAELRSGSIDFTVDLAPDQLNELVSDSNLEEVRRPSFNVGYLGLNPSYEPLSKPEVRRAIAMAINRSEIVEAFWSGLATTDSHFTPPSMKEFQAESLGDYEYNPDRAKQMLADAGYPNGFDLELWYMPVSRPYYPTPKPIAEAFAADLSTIGINVTLNTKDWAAYLEDRNKPPGFQSFMLGWTGDYGDPDNFLYAHFGPGATSDLGNWTNERVVQLLNEAREVSEEGDRAALYAEVDELLFEEAVRIPIVHSEPLLAQRSNLSGWKPSPFGSEPFDEIEKS
ncbi:ABC transporter substrate-binding protein [Leptolyngbya sp. AN02str]|uniref:ABC transporter substrate-binding protein n=1 Tax=Leptolyngbya sp. AN02str TaxID=3423363 RepID=UPI003D3227FE